MMSPTTAYPTTALLFQLDTAQHLMSVMHDDGVYRHVRFQAPGSGIGWFELVTWPGGLTITGDMETYVFRRLTDMFEFFATTGDINPGYWEQKEQGGKTREYSPERLDSHVMDLFREYADEHGWVLTQVRNLWDELCTEILDHPDDVHEDESAARAAISGFTWASTLDDEELEELPPFRFYDTWEWDLRDFTHHFLWACFAIRWGVNQYNASIGTAPLLPPFDIEASRDLAQRKRSRHLETFRNLRRAAAARTTTARPRMKFL